MRREPHGKGHKRSRPCFAAWPAFLCDCMFYRVGCLVFHAAFRLMHRAGFGESARLLAMLGAHEDHFACDADGNFCRRDSLDVHADGRMNTQDRLFGDASFAQPGIDGGSLASAADDADIGERAKAAQGRRNYLDCRLDIFNDDETLPVPWSGYYWTVTTAGTDAKALYFDLNTATRTWNSIDPSRSMQRANAMPVRCVRE